MTTSNKILLTAFLAAVVAFTGIHLALYAKFKMGRYTSMEDVYRGQQASHDLKKSNHIVADGISNLRILPSDTFRIEIEKDGFVEVKYEQKGDTLIIHGDSVITLPNGQPQNRRTSRTVSLFLPGGESIAASNSEIYLQGTTDSSKRASYQLVLEGESNFNLMDNAWQDSATRYFDQIGIRSTNSTVSLARFAEVNNLNIDLQSSNFDDKEASIKRLSINTDVSSHINMQGRNLRNLNKQ